jgi:hypothetical protein
LGDKVGGLRDSPTPAASLARGIPFHCHYEEPD